MTDAGLPREISLKTVEKVSNLLNLNPDQVRSVHIENGVVAVTLYREDEDGELMGNHFHGPALITFDMMVVED